MTHKTNLFAGWWLYTGLIGLGVALCLFGYGGLYARLGLAVLVLLAVAALAAFFSGRGPTVTAATILSESGVTVTVTGPGNSDIGHHLHPLHPLRRPGQQGAIAAKDPDDHRHGRWQHRPGCVTVGQHDDRLRFRA